jgi:hypothetical protein
MIQRGSREGTESKGSNGFPETSVVIVNWNGMEFLPACLEALTRQSYTDFETIIVDNGSEDGSTEFVGDNFPQVRVVSLGRNHGFGGGNNIGIGESKGEFVVLLNNDTEAEPGWLAALVRGAKEHPKAGMCASKMVFADNPGTVDSAGDELLPFGQTFTYRHYPADHPDVNVPRKCFYACAGAALYRKSMLEDIGLFDEIYHPIYFEDCDLGFRAKIAGYECWYVPSAVVRHKVSATMKKNSARYTYLYQRNMEYMLLINMPWPLYLKFLPMRTAYLFFRFVQALAEGNGVPFIRAKMEVLANLRRVIAGRKRVRRLSNNPETPFRVRFYRGWVRYKLSLARGDLKRPAKR